MGSGKRKALEIIAVVLMFLAMVLVLHNIVHGSGFQCFCFVVLFCALVSGALYYLYGCRKDAAKYFKVFIYLYALSTLFRLTGVAGNAMTDCVVAAAISFGVASVFSMAENLGKKKSVILGIVTLAANIYNLVRILTTSPVSEAIFAGIAYLVLAAVLNLMIIAKYEDKADRGSK